MYRSGHRASPSANPRHAARPPVASRTLHPGMWNVAALLLFGCTCCMTCGAAPKGHLKAFGEHRPSEGEIHVVDEGITPEAFYRECVMPAKACRIRKVTQAWPGFAKWDNDSYLASEFGHFNVTARHLRHRFGPRQSVD